MTDIYCIDFLSRLLYTSRLARPESTDAEDARAKGDDITRIEKIYGWDFVKWEHASGVALKDMNQLSRLSWVPVTWKIVCRASYLLPFPWYGWKLKWFVGGCGAGWAMNTSSVIEYFSDCSARSASLQPFLHLAGRFEQAEFLNQSSGRWKQSRRVGYPATIVTTPLNYAERLGRAIKYNKCALTIMFSIVRIQNRCQ